MKWIMSVSLGSDKRDHSVETEIAGELFKIERRGTNGSMERAIELIKEYDGRVDAFGMGGIDIYLGSNKKYIIKAALPILKAANKSPMVDGTGLKNTLERRIINKLAKDGVVDFRTKKTMMTCAIDRFGMAEAFEAQGADMTYCDAMFAIGLPIKLKSIKALERLAKVLMPVLMRLPFEMLYPTGEKQNSGKVKYKKVYDSNEIIAGDYHYIRKYLPSRIDGKIIITNTVTQADVDLLKERGAKMLITSTPNIEGRSFATNVMEAVLIALSGKPFEQVTEEDYELLLDKMDLKPRIDIF